MNKEQLAKLDEAKQRIAEATRGPWDWTMLDDGRIVIYDDSFLNRHIASTVNGGVESTERELRNAHLIANSPTWLSELVEIIEQQEATIATMTEAVSAVISESQKDITKSKAWSDAVEKEALGLRESLDIAVSALREIEEGFRMSVHGNPTCYHVAAKALSRIAQHKE